MVAAAVVTVMDKGEISARQAWDVLVKVCP